MSDWDMMDWIDANEWEPILPPACRAKGSIGIPVLVVAPRLDTDGLGVAYFGRRVENKPGFYFAGVPLYVTHWMPIPELPD